MRRLQCGVANYRLAPEAPYPAALTDALQVYETILSRGFEPRNIVLAGDSAGAGLALALALKLRDSGKTIPAGLALMSPWVNLVRTRPSAFPDKKDPILSTAWINNCAHDYLAGDIQHPELVSPLMANLAGLPPVFIQVAKDEILLEDSRELSAKLRAAGVAVEYQEFPGLWHIFHLHAGWLRAADEALKGIAAFVLRVTPVGKKQPVAMA
jgi:monoterpene epsilon-lactone hydrolase